MNYSAEIKEIKRQLANLSNSFLQSQRNLTPIVEKTDDSFNKIPQVDSNTTGVMENDLAICDIADLSDENSNAIEELALMLQDHEDRIAALEGKEGKK